MKHGMDGIGIYWCLVEMLYEENGYLPIEYDRITFELRTEKAIIESVITEFELFENDENKFWSNSILDRLQERVIRSEKAKNSVNKRWKPLEKNTNVLRPNYDSNTTCYTNKEKNSIEKNNKEKNKKENIGELILPDSIKKETWEAYLEMRKTIKKPATKHAQKLIISKLAKMPDDPNLILEQSIEGAWQNIYELKKNGNGQGDGNIDAWFKKASQLEQEAKNGTI
jgi:hypothetical protein